MSEIGDWVLKAADSNATLVERHFAFERLVARFQDMAYASAYARLGDRFIAEDVAQRSFITAWQKLSQLRQPDAFPGWFKRVVLSECNRLSRGKKLLTISLDDAAKALTASEDPRMSFERVELEKVLFRSIQDLSEADRTVITLFYLKEESHRDIAAFLEVPMTTVAKRLHSAKHRLRDKMMARFKANVRKLQPSRNSTFAERVRAGIYDEYIGQYQFETRPELVFQIFRQGDTLLSEGGGQRNILIGSEDIANELKVTEFDGRGEFIRDVKGSITQMLYYENGLLLGRANKIT